MENINEIKRNGSGYYDQTAYNAIKNLTGGAQMEAKAGEIWEIEKMNNEIMEAVVLAAHERYATIVQLVDTPDGNDFKINALSQKWTNTGKLQYAFDSKFVRFVKKMKEEEYTALMDAIAKSLGIEQKTVEKIVEVENKVPVNTQEQQKISVVAVDMSIVEGERDAYKHMYEGLLRILTNGKAGA